MSVEKNIAVVKDFFAAMGGDRQAITALTTPDIEWIIPGEGLPLAGTHRGHAAQQSLLDIASQAVETRFPHPPEYAAQGDRVLVVGFAEGTSKPTGKVFEDGFVFATARSRASGLCRHAGAGAPASLAAKPERDMLTSDASLETVQGRAGWWIAARAAQAPRPRINRGEHLAPFHLQVFNLLKDAAVVPVRLHPERTRFPQRARSRPDQPVSNGVD